ncbi:hypothetical protein F8M41_016749 [Gigaspora margarita]|uniref:Uncharacterized protein n=1 Tax=Gigaspora margarita TaxID=4874 RepID=A0A8H4EUL7_GIGMA|nr:hypothetical protein F8M41_016749 [Gigaspora margarita]
MMLDDYILADSEFALALSASTSSTLASLASSLSALASSASALSSASLSLETHESSMLSMDTLFDNESDVSNDLSNPLELVHGLTFPNWDEFNG